MRVLFLGFGDLAQRTAKLFLASGWKATGMNRSGRPFPGVDMVRGDCRDSQQLAKVLPGHDLVVVTLTPDEYSEAGYRRAYIEPAGALQESLDQLRRAAMPLLLWVSSTSVYGQGAGEWVDENTPTDPAGFSGKALLESERMIRSAPVAASIIRFSGIYGRGSGRQLEQVREGQCAPAAPVKWSNRIHADDCARVIHHLAQRHFAGKTMAPLFLASDCEPAPLHDVHRWLASQLNVTFQSGEAGKNRGNRRCDNSRLLATSFEFRYPTFREGYAAFMAELGIEGDVSLG